MQTTLPSSPVVLGPSAVIHLADDLAIDAHVVNQSFWTHALTGRPEFTTGRILSMFDYTTTWTHWERHPQGDELVYLLSGDVQFLLDDGTAQREVSLVPGQAAIVPAGTWHHAVVRSPSRLLFITPTPARTEQRPASTFSRR